MFVGCPRCTTTFRIDESRMRQAVMTACCTSCGSLFRVARPPGISVNFVNEPAGAPPRVLIAHESPAFCETVRTVLEAGRWDVSACHDGASALVRLQRGDMAVALLDVALPGRYGFEVCEALRANPLTAGIKVLLIASIYDKTRYKRLPGALYGADDYIEKHHIPDLLVDKVRRLLADNGDGAEHGHDRDATGPPPSLSADEVHDARTTLKREEEAETTVTAAAPTPSEGHVKARRLARIIASDIALYNQETVQEGVRSGSFYTLLADDIAEGRALYLKRVSEEIRNSSNYLEDAFADLIAKVQRELSL